MCFKTHAGYIKTAPIGSLEWQKVGNTIRTLSDSHAAIKVFYLIPESDNTIPGHGQCCIDSNDRLAIEGSASYYSLKHVVRFSQILKQ